jgi:hypothetical protein
MKEIFLTNRTETTMVIWRPEQDPNLANRLPMVGVVEEAGKPRETYLECLTEDQELRMKPFQTALLRWQDAAPDEPTSIMVGFPSLGVAVERICRAPREGKDSRPELTLIDPDTRLGELVAEGNHYIFSHIPPELAPGRSSLKVRPVPERKASDAIATKAGSAMAPESREHLDSLIEMELETMASERHLHRRQTLERQRAESDAAQSGPACCVIL